MKETRSIRFKRLAEARVNKIIKMVRLLGNLSVTTIYAYEPDAPASMKPGSRTGSASPCQIRPCPTFRRSVSRILRSCCRTARCCGR